MTKFDELMDIITHNKNKGKNKESVDSLKGRGSHALNTNEDDDDIEIEVSGTDSTKAPLVASANEELDPDIIDMLYRSNRNRVPRGEGASAWDSDY
jgi:hypothetical protein